MRILFVFLLLSFKLFAQQQLSDEQLIDLKKSILIHAIKYSNESDYEFKKYYLTDKWTLRLEIEKVTDTFKIPNCNWTYFEVINNNFSFEKTSGKFRTPIFRTFSHGGPIYFSLNKRGLIALDEKNDLVYLGGGFGKSSLAHKFNLNEDKEDTFYNYLKIKFYNYNLDKIKRIRKNKKTLIFKAFSWTLMKKIKISVNRISFEDVYVIE